MVIVIYRYKSVLSRLTNAQNVQFLADILKNAGPYIANVPALSIVSASLAHHYNLVNDFFQQNRKMFETEIVVHVDTGRDFTTRAAAAKVKYFYTYALTPEDKEDARRLDFIFDTYKKAEKKDYKAETTYIRRLIANLREWPALLAKFGLTALIDKLETENNDFEDSYDERSLAQQLIRLKGDMKNLRINANKAFSDLCDAVTGLRLTPLSAEVKAELENTVLVLNRHIQEYTTIYHRHAGISARHPGNNGEDEDGDGEEENGGGEGNGEGGETPDIGNPDITNPENPENPDIENPPPPPFLPDFE
ncbi:hypothetical protein FACS1894181_05700 [Bacteroidia bacterium]|nr:hypothetical protein FACS1894181_05700 [Bacteroidia bacterium]